MAYTKRYFITWRRRVSFNYHMNDALELAKRMRRRGHEVMVHRGEGGRGGLKRPSKV